MCKLQVNVIVNEKELMLKFDDYSRNYKSLFSSTIKNRHVYIQRFFKWFYKQKYYSLKEVNFDKLAQFLTNYHGKYSLESSRKLHLALRSFFTYCRLYNIIEYDFRPLLPLKRTYSKSYIPAVLKEDELEILIKNSKTDLSKNGIRNYAILLLLICYGVRGCQIRTLKFIDINWKESTIYFKACKNSNSITQLLLPDVGNAIIDYIENARPASSNDTLFLSTKPPQKDLTSSGLSTIIQKMIDKANIALPYNALKGTHLFRHTFASRLLSSGESFKNISDLLGHKTYESTMIYTKIDINNLKKVCLDWGGF